MVSDCVITSALLTRLSDCIFDRNYHVFYYLLRGASPELARELFLLKSEEYHYLNQVCLSLSRCLLESALFADLFLSALFTTFKLYNIQVGAERG